MGSYRLRLGYALQQQIERRHAAHEDGDQRAYESAGAAIVALDELADEELIERLRPALAVRQREVRR